MMISHLLVVISNSFRNFFPFHLNFLENLNMISRHMPLSIKGFLDVPSDYIWMEHFAFSPTLINKILISAFILKISQL